MSSAGASILAVGLTLPVFYLLYSLFWGKDAPANPWGAVGLEWTTSSPPPTENFEEQPIVTWEAYEFSRKEPDVVRASPNDTSTPV
jgi:cytochrome c oxidase subunit 1